METLIFTKQKFSAIRITAAFLSFAVLVAAPLGFALAEFNPSQLISDSQFADTKTFGGAAGVQQFLALKGSILANTDPIFLLKLKEPQAALLKNGLSDPEPNLGRLRTAAELIWDASTAVGMNPQVIIVTLQKEQTLITRQFPSDASLQTALIMLWVLIARTLAAATRFLPVFITSFLEIMMPKVTITLAQPLL